MSKQYKDFITMSGIDIQENTIPIPEDNKQDNKEEFSEMAKIIDVSAPEQDIKILTKDENNTEFNEIGEDDSSGIIRYVMDTVDDIVFYGRSYIENNLINISDNEDFSIIFPNIYIGNYSTSTNKILLKNLGITNIITVLPPSYIPLFPDDFKYLHISAYDNIYQDMTQYFDKTNKYIEDVLNNNGRIFIHCMAGRSRSITIFIAFLINVLKGCYKYSDIALINNDNKINITEYRQFIKSIKPNKITYIDNDNNIIKKKEEDENENNEKINKIEQEQPKLSRKEENFIIYKKQNIITHLDNLCAQYNDLKKSIIIFNNETPENEVNDKINKFSKIIMNEIVSYVCKYRPIAEPNDNFVNQLYKILL